jgi:hypothetical protein
MCIKKYKKERKISAVQKRDIFFFGKQQNDEQK